MTEAYQLTGRQVLNMEFMRVLWFRVVDVNKRNTSKIDSHVNATFGLEDYWRCF